jgi:hypothetical protein
MLEELEANRSAMTVKEVAKILKPQPTRDL